MILYLKIFQFHYESAIDYYTDLFIPFLDVCLGK